MSKKKFIRTKDKPLNLFAEGGQSVVSTAFSANNLGSTIGNIGGGITGVVGAGLANAQIADTSGIEADTKAKNNMVVGANDYDSLLSDWGAWNMAKSDYRAKDVRGVSGGQQAMNTVGGVMSGAASGAKIGGPVGGIIGGAAGLISGIGGIFAGNRKAKKKARELNRKATDANDRALTSFETKAANIDTQSDLNMLVNFAAYGGYYPTSQHGSEFGNGVSFINEGGTHGENPYNGIPIGISPEGVPNMAEEGEVRFNDYIFSNRLFANKSLLKKINLPESYKGYSFAKIAEELSLESSERPNDPISKQGLIGNMTKLIQAQEEVKAKKDNKDSQMFGNMFDEGGPVWNKYSNFTPIGQDWYTPKYMDFVGGLNPGDPSSLDWTNRINSGEFGPVGGNKFDVPNIKRLATDRKKGPVHNAIYSALQNNSPQSPIAQFPQSSLPIQTPNTPDLIQPKTALADAGLPNESTTERIEEGAGPTWLRYAPVLGAGLGVVNDMFGGNRPDYSSADMILDSTKGIRNVQADPIGNYLQYTPFDRDYYTNKLNAQAGATRRGLVNTSGGNRATAQAGILASDYNYGENLGNLARQAEEYNLGQRERVEGFNRQTNMYNSEAQMRADMANQQGQALRMRGITEATQLRELANRRSQEAKSMHLTNLFDSLGDIGREQFERNMIKTDPSLQYTTTGTGKIKYKGTKTHKRKDKK